MSPAHGFTPGSPIMEVADADGNYCCAMCGEICPAPVRGYEHHGPRCQTHEVAFPGGFTEDEFFKALADMGDHYDNDAVRSLARFVFRTGKNVGFTGFFGR